MNREDAGRAGNAHGVTIRRAAWDDAPSIASVLHRSFAEYRASYTHEAFIATFLTQRQIEDCLGEGPVWVAALDGGIVGTVSAVDRQQALYIRSMAVLPSARRRRIGEMLLVEVQRFAVERGYRRLVLSTTPFLDRAIRLYERLGFRRTDEGPHDLFGTPLLTMAKAVGARSPKTMR
ncbi:MAG TPA: GNAT family N-acetyltransferase [Thermoanaerobaculia bacterium]